MKTLLLVNGPNLNLLGYRDKKLYGSKTLAEIEKSIKTLCNQAKVELRALQSNSEGALIDFLNAQYLQVQSKKINLVGIIMNAGAYSHTSIAIRDALEVFKPLETKMIEVHLSNIYAREEFRHKSHVSSQVTGVICGLGADGYTIAAKQLLALK